jgi:hypothetical protein
VGGTAHCHPDDNSLSMINPMISPSNGWLSYYPACLDLVPGVLRFQAYPVIAAVPNQWFIVTENKNFPQFILNGTLTDILRKIL